MNFEKLEEKIALDADAQVMGPAIPEGFDYIKPPVLMRPASLDPQVTDFVSNFIDNTPVQDLPHPISEDGLVDRNYIWDQPLDDLFKAYAADGEITLREARDLVVSSDDGGYISRFEVFQTINYIYNDNYTDLYNRQSQAFMLLATDSNIAESFDLDVDQTHLQEGIQSVQLVADAWWNAARNTGV